MMPAKKIPLYLLFFAAAALSALESAEPPPGGGHFGPVLCLALDSAGGQLLSGGRDGTLRVWAISPLEHIRQFQVSHLPILRIEINPASADIALLLSDSASVHILKVINRETGQEKFSVSLPEFPQAFKFSPKGNYIIVSKTDWKSLTFYNAATGRPLSYFSQGFGIVSFLFLSESENTLLTYLPSSGNFTYHDVKTGAYKEAVRSTPELKNLALYNPRYVMASQGQELMAVDIVNGSIAARTREPGIYKIAAGNKEEVLTLSRQGGRPVLSAWTFTPPRQAEQGRLVKSQTVSLPQEASDALCGADGRYLALSDGSIGFLAAGSSSLERQGQRKTTPVTAIFPEEGVLYAVTANKIYTFTSSLFMKSPPPETNFFFRAEAKPNRLSSPAGFVLSGGRKFLWTLDGEARGRITEAEAGRTAPVYESVQPIVSVKEAEGFLFVLEKNGSVKKIDTASMKAVYEYPAWNIQSIAPLDGKILWAGKSKGGELDSPLLTINTETGETVPLKTPRQLLLAENLIYDALRGRMYYIGLVESSPEKTGKRIFSTDIRRPETPVSLAADPIAAIAGLYCDADEGAVYANLDLRKIHKLSGSRRLNIETNNELPLSLDGYGNLLFALNSNGSVSAWEKKTGKLAGTLYILEDGSWAAVAASGEVIRPDDGKGL
ncbi:MAG: hypothetical protein LBC67_05635 [Spirochaetales bacterium]|nr:hypothetical protein [Spirochaetales bacterium]